MLDEYKFTDGYCTVDCTFEIDNNSNRQDTPSSVNGISIEHATFQGNGIVPASTCRTFLYDTKAIKTFYFYV
jgi:hypothetical protein